MKKSIPYILIILCLIAGVIFYFKGCESKPGPDHSGDKVFTDSVTALVKGKLSEFQHVYDSVKAANAILQQAKDSLTSIVKEYKIDLHQRGQDIQGLLDELDASENAKDTLRTLTACDSLKTQFASAKGLVGAYIHANDSLAHLNSQIIASKDTINNRLNSMFTESNQALFAVQLKYDALYNDYKKLNVKAKRFAIGPSVGAFVTNKGLGYGVGMTISWSIIKF